MSLRLHARFSMVRPLSSLREVRAVGQLALIVPRVTGAAVTSTSRQPRGFSWTIGLSHRVEAGL